MDIDGVSVIIPSWNGYELLKKNLPFLFDSLKHSNYKYEVIVVDDGSSDESVDFLKKNYPEIKLVEQKENLGFSKSCNNAVKKSSYSILYFLNTDVTVTKNFLEYLIPHFLVDNVFAVGSIPLLYSSQEYMVVPEYNFKYGFLLHKPVKIDINEKYAKAFFVEAGYSAFNKEKFLTLGGFDELYSPCYYEDIDLCYRANKREWISIIEFRSRIKHKGSESINRRYSLFKKKRIFMEKTFIFSWKNIEGKSMILKHLLFLPFAILYFLFSCKIFAVLGFVDALKKLRKILEKRKRIKNGKDRLLF